MLSLLLAPSAFALDCAGRNQDTCDAVNDLAAMVNAEAGATVIADGNVAPRFKTANIYNQLEQVRLAGSIDGCRTDFSFDGYTGGTYDSKPATQFIAGSASEGGAWRDFSGDIDFGAREFSGLDDGTTSLGDIFSAFNDIGQLVGNRDGDGFATGRWIRTVGNRGVFVTLHGDCPGTSSWDAFDPWYQGVIPSPPVPTNLALAGTASQSTTYNQANPVGVASFAIDGVTAGNYFVNGVATTFNGFQEWWQVDLGAVYFIEDVVLWNRTDCCGARLNNFNVYVSDVPFASTVAATTAADPNVTTIFQVAPPAPTSTFAFDRTGRYVRVQLTLPAGDDYLQLAEVQVFGY